MTNYDPDIVVSEYVNDGNTRRYILVDWRGLRYEIGSKIVYPRMSGRSVEMSDGEITDIYLVKRDSESWTWKRWEGGSLDEFADRSKMEWRVKVQPSKSSQGFWRGGWAQGTGQEKLKEITLMNIENVTVVNVIATYGE